MRHSKSGDSKNNYKIEILIFISSFIIAGIIQIVFGYAQKPIPSPTFAKLVQNYIWPGGLFPYFAMSLICWCAGVIIFRVRSHSRCPYFESRPDGPEVTMSLACVLRDIGGLYDDLQDSHQPLGEPTVRAKIRKLRDNPIPSIPAIAFVANNCPISSYAQLARELDSMAVKSIFSVNTSLPSDLFNHGARDSVLAHLEVVNNRRNLRYGRQRIQILAKDDTVDCPGGIPRESNFNRDLNSNQELSDLWNNCFIAKEKGIIYKNLFWDNQVTPHEFFGDFMLYDEELLLLYDYATRKLLVLVGRRLGTTFGSIFHKE
jgi:hypothetical protein